MNEAKKSMVGLVLGAIIGSLLTGCSWVPKKPECYRDAAKTEIVCDTSIEECEAADQGVCNVLAAAPCGPVEVWVSVVGAVPDGTVVVAGVTYAVVTGPFYTCPVSQ